MMGSAVEPRLALMAAELGIAIFVKATLVLAVAAGLVWLSRHRSAASRYVVWAAALTTLVLLPALSMTLPAWRAWELRLFERTDLAAERTADGAAEATVDVAANIQSDPAASTGEIALHAAPSALDDVSSPQIVSPSDPGEAVEPTPMATAPNTPPSRRLASNAVVALAALALLAWMAGAVLALLRMAVHGGRAFGMSQRASRGDPDAMARLLNGLDVDPGLWRRVRLVFSHEASFPFAVGTWRPTIVLPLEARGWPEERLRSVVLHELAHVARWDYPAHLLLEVICALYWPNPLVRMAVRWCDRERECACDDFALHHGTPSHDYASHLLEIAQAQLQPRVAVGAVAMANNVGLLDRVRHVLHKQRDRAPLRPAHLLFGIGLAVFAVLPLAALDVGGTHEDARRAGLVLADFFDVSSVRYASAQQDEGDVPSLDECIRDLEQHADVRERRRAAWWLGEHESMDAVDALVRGLRDASPDVRLTCAWALGEIKDRHTIPELVDALTDDDDVLVREMAALSLGEIEHRSAIDPLMEAFDREEDLRGAIVWALGEIRGREAQRAREEAFDAWGRRPWRNQEVWTGHERRPLRVSRDLSSHVDRLHSGDSEERTDAAASVGLLGVRDRYDSLAAVEHAVDELLDRLRDPDPEVRAMAIWSLDEINPSRSRHFHHDHDHDEHDHEHEHEHEFHDRRDDSETDARS